jgi:hypothetical protein
MSGDKIGWRKYYVCMTDRFMSGWGPAEGKDNKLVIGTDDYNVAMRILENARRRDGMKYVNLNTTRPHYSDHAHVSYHEPSDACLEALAEGDEKYIY